LTPVSMTATRTPAPVLNGQASSNRSWACAHGAWVSSPVELGLACTHATLVRAVGSSGAIGLAVGLSSGSGTGAVG